MTHNYSSRRKYGKHKKKVNPKHTGKHKLEEDRTISESRYHSMKVEDGRYTFTLGNWTDAGWFWSGNEGDSWLFLNRMRKSKVKDKLIKDMTPEEFKKFKEVLEEELEEDNYGLYSLSGDNIEWHFGSNEWVDVEAEMDYYQEEYGLTDEQTEELMEETWSNIEKRDFDDFIEEYGDSYKKEIKQILESSESMEELMNHPDWEDLEYEIISDVRDFRDEDYRRAVNEAMEELGYTKKKNKEVNK